MRLVRSAGCWDRMSDCNGPVGDKLGIDVFQRVRKMEVCESSKSDETLLCSAATSEKPVQTAQQVEYLW